MSPLGPETYPEFQVQILNVSATDGTDLQSTTRTGSKYPVRAPTHSGIYIYIYIYIYKKTYHTVICIYV